MRQVRGFVLRRLRDRPNEPPLLSQAEMVSVVREVFSSVADDPLIASAHSLEGLHAHTRAGMARSIDRRKQIPRRLAACQTLVRWAFLHKTRLGNRLRPVGLIKKKIMKNKRLAEEPFSRVLTGHDMYVKQANRERRAFICLSFLERCRRICFKRCRRFV